MRRSSSDCRQDLILARPRRERVPGSNAADHFRSGHRIICILLPRNDPVACPTSSQTGIPGRRGPVSRVRWGYLVSGVRIEDDNSCGDCRAVVVPLSTKVPSLGMGGADLRLANGTHQAQPFRDAWTPKGPGKRRWWMRAIVGNTRQLSTGQGHGLMVSMLGSQESWPYSCMPGSKSHLPLIAYVAISAQTPILH